MQVFHHSTHRNALQPHFLGVCETLGCNQFFSMKMDVYEMACEIYNTVGTHPFTVADAAEIVHEKSMPALGGRLFAMRNAAAIRIAFVTPGGKCGKHRIRSYQFTQKWILFKDNEQDRAARVERKHERARARAQGAALSYQGVGVVSNGG